MIQIMWSNFLNKVFPDQPVHLTRPNFCHLKNTYETSIVLDVSIFESTHEFLDWNKSGNVGE